MTPDSRAEKMATGGAVAHRGQGNGAARLASQTRSSAKDALGERRLAAGCAGGMALAAAGSWLRFALERTPRIDVHSVPFLLASAVSGAGLIVSGVCSLRLAPRASRLSWPALWRWA